MNVRPPSSKDPRPIKLALFGASGRMGQAIQTAARTNGDDFIIAARPAKDVTIDQLVDSIRDADVLIDFSLPAAFDKNLQAATRAQKPYVCGVTGLTADQRAALSSASGEIPLLYSANMSPGINLMRAAIAQMARGLGDAYDISIDELHHIHKKDAPSGTAVMLADEVRDARPDWDPQIQSRREGEAPGQHSVYFSGPAETLVLQHSVNDRSVFAQGALRAAQWIADKPAGEYSMMDVFQGL